jgi:hypothetical protein
LAPGALARPIFGCCARARRRAFLRRISELSSISAGPAPVAPSSPSGWNYKATASLNSSAPRTRPLLGFEVPPVAIGKRARAPAGARTVRRGRFRPIPRRCARDFSHSAMRSTEARLSAIAMAPECDGPPNSFSGGSAPRRSGPCVAGVRPCAAGAPCAGASPAFSGASSS